MNLINGGVPEKSPEQVEKENFWKEKNMMDMDEETKEIMWETYKKHTVSINPPEKKRKLDELINE